MLNKVLLFSFQKIVTQTCNPFQITSIYGHKTFVRTRLRKSLKISMGAKNLRSPMKQLLYVNGYKIIRYALKNPQFLSVLEFKSDSDTCMLFSLSFTVIFFLLSSNIQQVFPPLRSPKLEEQKEE